MNGFVYAIESGDLVKIGWSHKPLVRLSQIRTRIPHECRLLGVRQVPSASYERAFHILFSEWRESGEWFRKEGEVLDFIHRLQPVPQVSSARSALTMAKDIVGGATKLAAFLKITPQAVSQWRRVPVERVLDAEKLTGIPRHEFRPDIYPPPGIEAV